MNVTEVRLVLAECISLMQEYEMKIEGEWGSGRSLIEIESAGHLPDAIINARRLMYDLCKTPDSAVNKESA